MAETPAQPEQAGPNWGWFGKLPGAGDFVSRRMAYGDRATWDRWCIAGMEALAQRGSVLDPGGICWGFLLPTGTTPAQLGVLAPSWDRGGRRFPVVVTLRLTPVWLNQAALLTLAWAQVLDEARRDRLGLEAVDQRLNQALNDALLAAAPDDETTLPPGAVSVHLPWPGLTRSFDAQGGQSYWWSVPPASTGHRALVHEGPPDGVLFGQLWGS